MDLDPLAVVRRRLHDQRLAGRPFDTPAEAVASLGAVQAQEHAEVLWSLGQRVRGGAEADVQAAADAGQILRTHVLRPTWHYVAAADLRWLLALTAPRVHQANGYMYRKLELDRDLLVRGADVVAAELAGGRARTRTELRTALARHGIEVDGMRLGYVLAFAELEALVCSGPRPGRQHTYALLDERVPPAADHRPDDARAALARRFFRSHGPATLRDLTNWSSLTVADARAGIEAVRDRLEAQVDDEGREWLADPASAPASGPTGAFLLPMYDECTVGYKELRVVMAAEPPPGVELLRPIVLDGRTVGSWSRTLSARSGVVDATLFATLAAADRRALDAAVEGFGRFLGRPIELRTSPAATTTTAAGRSDEPPP